MPRCQECGAHISRGFVRVFGIDGKVYGCRECMKSEEMDRGHAANSDAGLRTSPGLRRQAE